MTDDEDESPNIHRISEETRLHCEMLQNIVATALRRTAFLVQKNDAPSPSNGETLTFLVSNQDLFALAFHCLSGVFMGLSALLNKEEFDELSIILTSAIYDLVKENTEAHSVH